MRSTCACRNGRRREASRVPETLNFEVRPAGLDRWSRSRKRRGCNRACDCTEAGFGLRCRIYGQRRRTGKGLQVSTAA
jgi:hypothetical protein